MGGITRGRRGMPGNEDKEEEGEWELRRLYDKKKMSVERPVD